ncbi:hypothetical protein BJX66DRAFT_308045 [Aspergillus keveii]|uniref:Uncharacterized protein n=1 Tax=Aspergillus keveii TaxID=714993 RepID=A0ABR4FZV5_9EURO
MGKALARLIGSSIGFTSEAINAARQRNKNSTCSAFDSSRSIVDVRREDIASETDLPVRAKDPHLLLQEDPPPYSPGEAGYPCDDGEKRTIELSEKSIDEDEAAWQLDEATEELLSATSDQAQYDPGAEGNENDTQEIKAEDSEDEQAKKRERMIRSLVAMAGPPPPQPQRLPFPVIIPQRRPGAKKRGFVRAYAPALANCGISQDMFLKFVSDFHKASQASMWLQVVVVAADITGYSPSLIVSLTALAIQIVADTAQQLQIRHRTNSYLDRANEEIFMPRGQYALIMKFKDRPLKPKEQQKDSKDASVTHRLAGMFSTEQININQSSAGTSGDTDSSPLHPPPERQEFDAAATISKYTHNKEHPEMNAWKQGMQHFRMESGVTRGEMQLPECAPLIFPEIDRAATRVRDGLKPKSTLQSGRTWVRDYIDRKSQASFEAEHQGSAVAVPASGRKAFTSRYNDPNHPANNGNLLSTLSGGLYVPKPCLFERAGAAIKESLDKRRAAQGLPPSETWAEKWARKRKESGSRLKILREDILYLMVVNMPTEEELSESVAKLQYLAQQGDF